MRISYFSPAWLERRRQRSQSGRSRSLLCLPVLAVALLAFVLPATAGAAEWSETSVGHPEEPFGEQENSLNGVACNTANSNCFTVGYREEITSESVPWIDHKASGEALKPVPGSISLPKEGVGARLEGIACLKFEPHAECNAVGYAVITPGVRRAYAIRLNEGSGKNWNVVATPEPTGAVSSELKAVTCYSAATVFCMAVGVWENSSHVRKPFALDFTTIAGEWKLESFNLSEVQNVTHMGVSCLPVAPGMPAACEAVGTYENTTKKVRPFAVRWTTTSGWSSQTLPLPVATGAIGAFGVSCSLSNACTLVGSAGGSTEPTEKSLAERWNGTEWKIQTTPNTEAAGGSYNVLAGVSCAKATECIAVGQFAEPKTGHAQIWNGTEWKFQKTSTNELLGTHAIACATTTTYCLSVGQDIVGPPFPHAFAEVYK